MAFILASKALKVTAPPQGSLYQSNNPNDGSTTNVYVQGGRQRRMRTSDALISHGVKYFQGRSSGKSSKSSGVASYGPEGSRGGNNGDYYRSSEPYAPQQGYYERQQAAYPPQSTYGSVHPPQYYASSDRYYAPPQGQRQVDGYGRPQQEYYASREGNGPAYYERPPSYSPDFRGYEVSKK